MSYKMINLFFLHTMGRIKENFRVDSVCIGWIERPVTLSSGWRHCDVTLTSNFKKMSHVDVILCGSEQYNETNETFGAER